MIDWSDEQRLILNHDGGNARLQAGPGTGKSTTMIELARILSEGRPNNSVRIATFTRAATRELANKALSEEIAVPVTTVHSLALSLLLHNSRWPHLPLPLRIPDDWELDKLIREDLRSRLSRSQPGMTKRKIKRLEREMAAQWESLDDSLLLADIDPVLRSAYIVEWTRQKSVFGHSSFAEMPKHALAIMEDHPEADDLGIQFLIVDEYQDLNRCEMNLLLALNGRGVAIFAVGDEDQSIYSWRMAAPEGIRNFDTDFGSCKEYSLSVSQRCGRKILDAAKKIISVAPGRNTSLPVVGPGPNNSDGVFSYLKVGSAQAERKLMVAILKSHHDRDDIPYDRMAVLTRSDHDHRWSALIREALVSQGIQMTDVEAALEPLHTDAARQLFAIVKLVLNRSDDLSWWTLLKLCRGVSDEFIMSIADQAVERGERFSQQLTSLDGVRDSSRRNSANQAKRRFDEIVTILDRVAAEVSDDLDTFLEWFKCIAAISSLAISEELEDVLVKASAEFAGDGGIREFVPQLEPLARDVALEGSGVAIMTCGRSKGLTFDVVVTLGVEQELFPSPMSSDPNEDRRLLYVATTRARLASYLTMASYRQDATAYTGSGDAVRSRSRCSFLYDVGISPRWIDDAASFAPETIVDPALS